MFAIYYGKGFKIELPNGYTLSVQFSENHYCERKQTRNQRTPTDALWRSNDAEVTAYKTHGRSAVWVKFPFIDNNDDVYPHVNVEQMLQMLDYLRTLPSCVDAVSKETKHVAEE